MDGLGGLIPSLAQWRPYAQSVRFPFPDTLGIFVASSIYSFLAILFTTALLVRSYHASFGTAAFLALMVFIGTPLAFYTFCSPSFIHAADSLLVAAAFYFAVFNEADSGKVRSRNLLTGFFLALSVMLRNNNIVLILPIVGGILFFQRAQGWRRIMITGLEIFAGALPVLMMHAYFNWTQYGRIFATGYRVDLSQEGLSPDDLMREAHQDLAATQVSVSNTILSLRLLAVTDWSEVVEETSLVDTRLRRDPSGFYDRSDSAVSAGISFIFFHEFSIGLPPTNCHMY